MRPAADPVCCINISDDGAAFVGAVLLFVQHFGRYSMVNNLQKKPFLDYPARIEHLKRKQLIINDEFSATTALEKVGYYALINGYKDIFKDPATNSFYPGTTFDNIYNKLKKTIKKFNPSDKTMELMSFPTNWMSILRIKVY